MQRLSTVSVGLFICMAGASSDALAWGKKEAAPTKGMMMPDLQQVLGDAYEIPPELSSRAAPGHILRISKQRIEVFKSRCVAGKPGEHDVTSINMQSQLSGGVRMNMGLGRVKGQASSSMALNFQSPYIQSYEEAEFTLTRDCVKQLKSKARASSVADLVVVKEVMMARINGCKKFDASMDVGLAGRGASASAGGSCEMISDAPVVIGYRTVPVTQMVRGLVPAVSSTPTGGSQDGAAAAAPAPPQVKPESLPEPVQPNFEHNASKDMKKKLKTMWRLCLEGQSKWETIGGDDPWAQAGACKDLAEIYEDGSGGVKVRQELANALYFKACRDEVRSDQACHYLGINYRDGIGFPKSPGIAASFFKEACEPEYGPEYDACSDLGQLYELGAGVSQSHSQAAALYQKACKGDSGIGCNNLGLAYIAGRGVKKDAAAGQQFRSKACELGYEPGCK